MSEDHKAEVRAGQRFKFGANWARFLCNMSEERAVGAEQSLRTALGVADLAGKRFLDAGSGSGLFSLAARRLGAEVHSFDFDPQSVACTRALKEAYRPADAQWRIEEASVLDKRYLVRLGPQDVVYSWGVLHHTGSMWEGLGNLASLVAPGGMLYVAIYNDQGWVSRYWAGIKRLYARHVLLRPCIVLFHLPYLLGLRFLVRALSGRLVLERGMSLWHDMIDWVGGYPFEVAKPEEIFAFYRDRGFRLMTLKTCGGRHGCNEFVFVRA